MCSLLFSTSTSTVTIAISSSTTSILAITVVLTGCAYPAPPDPVSSELYDFVELEDWQKHADDDAANNDTQKDNQQRFNERGHRIESGLDLVVIEIRNFLEHHVDFARLFASGDHTH